MRDYQTLSLRVDERKVAYLELSLAEKRNALSALLIEELTDFATSVSNQKSIRVVVLSGKGKIFCAGGDLAWMKAQIGANRETRMREARKLAEMLKALNEMPVPLIGKIHGGAFGGGIGIACICDVTVAEQDTKFGLTETRLGLIPATIGPYVIARLSEGKARQVFMSARLFDAKEAQTLGVVSKICAAAHLDESIEFEIKPYLSAAPNAVGAAKALVRSMGYAIDDAVIGESISRLADTWEGAEASEGIEAFFSKRKPNWADAD
jgi:methylglutaconyl-CoA hydratase